MRVGIRVLGILATGILLAMMSPAAPGADDPAPQKADASKRAKSQTKPQPIDAGHLSTEDAVRGAAKQQVRQADSGKGEKAETSGDDVVEEFHPATAGKAADDAAATGKNKKTKNAPLKDVHGDVYGSTDPNNPGTNAAGGAIGASSKNKKSHIYVETDSLNPPR